MKTMSNMVELNEKEMMMVDGGGWNFPFYVKEEKVFNGSSIWHIGIRVSTPSIFGISYSHDFDFMKGRAQDFPYRGRRRLWH